jgi:hypothetical protein
MKKKAGNRTAALVLSALVLAGCSTPYRGDEEEETETGTGVIQADDLFVSTVQEDGRTKTVFRTNDEKYWSWKGATVWTVWEAGASAQPFTGRTVEMGKVNGYEGGGYGMVFCQGERAVGGKTEKTMLLVMINNRGEYMIGEVIGSQFTEYEWWKTSPHLNRNAGAKNEVTVTFDAAAEEFSLFLNGVLTETFRDDGEPVHREGRNGYLAVITPYDRFPVEDVDIYFIESR